MRWLEIALTVTKCAAPELSRIAKISGSLPAVEFRVQVTTEKGDQNVSVNKSDASDHMIDVTTRNGDVTILPAS